MAVKVLKPKKEAQKNFSMEVNIISSIKHKHIAPLIGMCLENGHLIFVHEFYPKGSLDHYLHGKLSCSNDFDFFIKLHQISDLVIVFSLL